MFSQGELRGLNSNEFKELPATLTTLNVDTKVPSSSSEPLLQKPNVLKFSPAHINLGIKAFFPWQNQHHANHPSALYTTYRPVWSHLHH